MKERTMDQQKTFGKRLIILAFLIVFIIPGMFYLAEKARQLSPEVLSVDTDAASNLSVSVRVVSTICEDAEKIDYSLVELSISGGKPPFELTITNSESELSGPYTIIDANSSIRIKVYGGDYFKAVVHSISNDIWSATIGLSPEAEICKATPTFTPEPSATETITNTPIPTNTEIIVISSTFTPTENSPFNSTATDTKRPKPGKTNTAESTQITATTDPQPSKTPDPQPTNTPSPQPTITPINPHPKACEDGIDNDGDGLIDYGNGPQNDPDCSKPSDPKESK
jgi:hypothetical protein